MMWGVVVVCCGCWVWDLGVYYSVGVVVWMVG